MFAKVSGDEICKLKHIEWTIDTSIQYCKWFWWTRGGMGIGKQRTVRDQLDVSTWRPAVWSEFLCKPVPVVSHTLLTNLPLLLHTQRHHKQHFQKEEDKLKVLSCIWSEAILKRYLTIYNVQNVSWYIDNIYPQSIHWFYIKMFLQMLSAGASEFSIEAQ